MWVHRNRQRCVDSSMCRFTACSTALWRSLTIGCCVCTVGKTSLITRFMYDSFDNTYQVTCVLCVSPMFWLPALPLSSTGPCFVERRRDHSSGLLRERLPRLFCLYSAPEVVGTTICVFAPVVLLWRRRFGLQLKHFLSCRQQLALTFCQKPCI